MSKKICVVGAGNWGRNHLKTLSGMGLLGGIVETDSRRLADLGKLYPEAARFNSLPEALKRSFDGYTVATPAETHFELARLLIENKKPVLVEKPIALRAREARELRALADKHQVNVMVGHVLLFHPAIQKIRELIHQDKIGKLQYLYSNRLNLGTIRTEENILWSFAPHDISIFQYFIEDKPLEIISRGGAFLQAHIHDSTMTTLTYPHNIVGHIFVSWLHPFKEHRLVVIGSKGMLSFEDSSEHKSILFYEKGVDWIRGEPVKRDGPTETIPYKKGFPLTRELEYFVKHLEGPAPAIANLDSALEVLEILEQATASLTGKPADTAVEKPWYCHPTSCVDDKVEIGEGTKIWHFSHVQSGTRIGKHCSLGQNVNIANNVRIGDYVKIQNNVSVYEGVELEDYVFCGPSMVFTNINRPRSEFPQRGSAFYQRTLVQKSASIGANATIVCGITIGKYAFIGAGATVTRDVPPHALVVGNPGRVIGWVNKQGERLSFDDQGLSTCGNYRLRDKRLVVLRDGPDS